VLAVYAGYWSEQITESGWLDLDGWDRSTPVKKRMGWVWTLGPTSSNCCLLRVYLTKHTIIPFPYTLFPFYFDI